MAIDMPPVEPVYEIQRAAPAIDSISAMLATSIAVARNQAASRGPILLDLDMSSRSMSSQDKMAASDIKETLNTGQPVMGSSGIPDSYVGERLKLAMAKVRLDEAQRDGSASEQDVRQVRCRMLSLALDKRAGAYVIGGERAAQEARNAIPANVIEECAAAAKKDKVFNRSFKESDVIAERNKRVDERPALASFRQTNPVKLSVSTRAAAEAQMRGNGF